MSPKKPKPASLSEAAKPVSSHYAANAHKTDGSNLNAIHGRDALQAYISSPTSFPATRVLSHDDNWVVINDAYPKSSVHILLLPRDPQKTHMHPFDALTDPEFLENVKTEVQKLKKLAASELRRQCGKYSSLDVPRYAALTAESPPETLPAGRDWESEIVAGVHAVPSMNHLHIHVLSRDRHSECLRHRKHYNSFATPFFVAIEDFPLAEDDKRRQPTREGYLQWDMKCWRCGRNFGNGFKKLKEHLETEYDEWKRI